MQVKASVEVTKVALAMATSLAAARIKILSLELNPQWLSIMTSSGKCEMASQQLPCHCCFPHQVITSPSLLPSGLVFFHHLFLVMADEVVEKLQQFRLEDEKVCVTLEEDLCDEAENNSSLCLVGKLLTGEGPPGEPTKERGSVDCGRRGTLWVNFRYELLSSLCFYHGILGHEERTCAKKDRDFQQNCLRASSYGPWLKAGNRQNYDEHKASTLLRSEPLPDWKKKPYVIPPVTGADLQPPHGKQHLSIVTDRLDSSFTNIPLGFSALPFSIMDSGNHAWKPDSFQFKAQLPVFKEIGLGRDSPLNLSISATKSHAFPQGMGSPNSMGQKAPVQEFCCLNMGCDKQDGPSSPSPNWPNKSPLGFTPSCPSFVVPPPQNFNPNPDLLHTSLTQHALLSQSGTPNPHLGKFAISRFLLLLPFGRDSYFDLTCDGAPPSQAREKRVAGSLEQTKKVVVASLKWPQRHP
ncbi:hypothetical protein Dimus_003204 [Dionaea muscipula]